MHFEESLEALNKIAQKLEDPQTTLGEGIKLFEQSLDLTRNCLKELNDGKARIDQIKNELDEIVKDL